MLTVAASSCFNRCPQRGAGGGGKLVFSLFLLCILLCCHNGTSLSSGLNRRDLLLEGAAVASGIGLFLEAANAAEVSSSSSLAPIAVLGASGRTGVLCVEACLKRGIAVRALTRSGQWNLPTSTSSDWSNLLSVRACDVKDKEAISRGVQGCRGVIYAASASKNGGTAKEIDNYGVVAAAEACVNAQVPRYVVLSSTATTRPKSLGYIFTNVLGGIMDEKRKGELGVYQSYDTTSSSAASCSYTIVRPGGLEEPKKNIILGPSSLEISQGDTLAGIISRADLAEVAVELALSNTPNLRNTALELYYTDSAQPCETRFKALLTNGVAPRLHGDTYEALFSGIRPNVDVFEP
jgi:uncharacterized protein YbjT (DUF2867 family)